MPSFFNFQQGRDPRGATNDSSPLLGRFRAVPDTQRRVRRNSLLPNLSSGRGFGSGYGSLFGGSREGLGDGGSEVDSSDDEEGVVRRWTRTSRDLWVEPKQLAVTRVIDKWWTRWAVLIVMPAFLVSCKTFSC